MLSPSQDGTTISSLIALSRNASVISSSSSSDSAAEPDPHLLTTPVRPRPLRTFSSPRSPSPASPTSRTPKPPSYLTKELAVSAEDGPKSRAASKGRSKSRARTDLSIEDFEVGESLGEGAYSTVLEATLLKTGKAYAVKVLDKNHLTRKNKTSTARVERLALIRLGRQHPGIVSLHWTFQDEWSLYFVLDLATNGEMQALVSRMGSLSTRCSQYYTAQMVDALAYMHSKGVIHRDLKPENLLLDSDFRLKIADFGTAKVLNADVETERFVGTAQYVAPELVVANESSESSDYWALGCVLYQMISGRFAFSGLSEYLTLQKVKQVEYTFPGGFDEQAKDLVQKLLVRDPTQRLGAGKPDSSLDVQALRSHPFFSGIYWTTLWLDPAPPLEAGLVKRQHPLAQGEDRNWEDVGSAWDAFVSNDDDQSVPLSPAMGDGMSWAEDSEGSALLLRQRQFDTAPSQMQSVDISLVSQVVPDDLVPDTSPPFPASNPILIPSSGVRRAAAESPSTGSPDSSSEERGVSLERITAGVQAMRPFRLPPEHGVPVEHERGRSQAPTPVQGNTLSSTELPPSLNPQENEVVLYRSIVEVRSIRRRASRLLKPIPGAQMKPKTREIILTNLRLISLKAKPSVNPSVKAELLLKAGEDTTVKEGKEKDKKKDTKETKGVLMSAEMKGEREFAVLSSVKTFHYATQDPQSASLCVEKINAAISSANEY